MTPKTVLIAVACAVLLAWSGRSFAAEYHSGEILNLDLPSALLSPKPLGPPSQFMPGPLDVHVDRDGQGAQARAESQAEPKAEPQQTETKAEPTAEPRSVVHKTVVRKTTRVAHLRVEKPRGAARTKLARRHGNPLDAQAFDTRIQVWPCRSGGICNWRR
jgi:hypothetical protein